MTGTRRESGLKSEDLREACTDASEKIDRLIYLSSGKRLGAGGSVSPVTERRAQTRLENGIAAARDTIGVGSQAK